MSSCCPAECRRIVVLDEPTEYHFLGTCHSVALSLKRGSKHGRTQLDVVILGGGSAGMGVTVAAGKWQAARFRAGGNHKWLSSRILAIHRNGVWAGEAAAPADHLNTAPVHQICERTRDTGNHRLLPIGPHGCRRAIRSSALRPRRERRSGI
jgi:hypothetical protein